MVKLFSYGTLQLKQVQLEQVQLEQVQQDNFRGY